MTSIIVVLITFSGGRLIDYIEKYQISETGGNEESGNLNDPPSSTEPTNEVDELLRSSQMLLNSVQMTLEESKRETEPIKDELEYNCGIQHSASGPIFQEGCVRQWAKELIVAVDALHSNNIILGHLSSQNLLLGKSGQMLLTYYHHRDFSKAIPKHKFRNDEFLAPDRLEHTAAADWYCVGVVLYELLTGEKFAQHHPKRWNYFELQIPESVQLSPAAVSLLQGVSYSIHNYYHSFINIYLFTL